MNHKIALLVPGNGKYFVSSKKINGKIHPFRRKIYEYINKSGYICEYIGYGDLSAENLKQYDTIFLLNIEQLNSFHIDCLKQHLENNGNVILTYKTSLAKEFGISFAGKSRQKSISFHEETISYQIVNVSNIIYKINRKYFKSMLPIDKFLKLPVVRVRWIKDEHEILATWNKTNLPAILQNKSYPGRVIYFSGILAGVKNGLLKYILSLIRPENYSPSPILASSKRCCVTIFHDYEREYGIPKFEKYADRGLNFILEIEKKYNIKATFNIVGKVCKTHPETIKQIIQDGHEIANHTYGHEIPIKTNRKDLDSSINLCLKEFKTKIDVELNRGFRAPESKWSTNLVEILEKSNFLWDAEDEKASIPYNLVLGKRLRLMRIPITYDDYFYISKNTSATDMLNKLKRIVEKGIEEKGFIAIGFHPWIEGMKEERLQIFEEFLSYLSSKNEITVMTFGQVCNWWNDRSKGF